MRLRPRYSLLTLLIVMAAVAFVVQVWVRPHHVVEKTSPTSEIEYTFRYDWRLRRTVHGPVIERHFNATHLAMYEITYVRQGQQFLWSYHCSIVTDDFVPKPVANNPLTGVLNESENAELEAAINREKQRPIPPGFTHWESRGSNYGTIIGRIP